MHNERDRWFLGTFVRILVNQKESEGRMTVVEQRAARDFSPPLHVHEIEDAILHVVAGTVTIQVGDTTRVLEAGEAGFLPHGLPHTFRVDSDEAHMLHITTPGGFDDFVLENSVAAASPSLPAAPPDIDPAALYESSVRHGAPLVGPPLARPPSS